MEVLYPHCAGLDVHKDTVVACVRHMVNGTVKREVRTSRLIVLLIICRTQATTVFLCSSRPAQWG